MDLLGKVGSSLSGAGTLSTRVRAANAGLLCTIGVFPGTQTLLVTRLKTQVPGLDALPEERKRQKYKDHPSPPVFPTTSWFWLHERRRAGSRSHTHRCSASRTIDKRRWKPQAGSPHPYRCGAAPWAATRGHVPQGDAAGKSRGTKDRLPQVLRRRRKETKLRENVRGAIPFKSNSRRRKPASSSRKLSGSCGGMG